MSNYTTFKPTLRLSFCISYLAPILTLFRWDEKTSKCSTMFEIFWTRSHFKNASRTIPRILPCWKMPALKSGQKRIVSSLIIWNSSTRIVLLPISMDTVTMVRVRLFFNLIFFFNLEVLFQKQKHFRTRLNHYGYENRGYNKVADISQINTYFWSKWVYRLTTQLLTVVYHLIFLWSL